MMDNDSNASPRLHGEPESWHALLVDSGGVSLVTQEARPVWLTVGSDYGGKQRGITDCGSK